MRILIGGDVCLTGRCAEYAARGDAAGIFGPFLARMQAADLTAVNLECPSNPAGAGSAGKPASPPGTANLLAQAGVGLVNLANNHIRDFGDDGVRLTLQELQNAGLATVGAGTDLRDPHRPFRGEFGGGKLAVCAFTPHPEAAAAGSRPGANPADMEAMIREVRELSPKVDFCLVLVHAGTAYGIPNPANVRTGRALVNAGARVVVFQQPHRPGCWERYRGGYILYGQGNLIRDARPSPGLQWHRGVWLQVEVTAGGEFRTELIPYFQCASSPGLEQPAPEEAAAMLDDMERRSREIEDPELVPRRWGEWLEAHESQYVPKAMLNRRWWRRLNRRLPVYRLLTTGRYRRRVLERLMEGG